MRKSDRWHSSMYDAWLAKVTLDSEEARESAEKEADFLVSQLGLRPGSRVMDVPCGAGRHCAALARRTVRVTGIDLNPACLRLARAACRGLPVVLREGEMSKLAPYVGKFDAVINLFTSFGYYFSDRDNERFLAGMVSALRPGGHVVIHAINPRWLTHVFRPAGRLEEKGKVLENDGRKVVLKNRRYDPKTKHNTESMLVFDRSTGRTKSFFHRERLYSRPELVAMMRRNGLENIRVFGGFSGERFETLGSSCPVYIGRKPR